MEWLSDLYYIASTFATVLDKKIRTEPLVTDDQSDNSGISKNKEWSALPGPGGPEPSTMEI
jgi:hypothetical protein